MHDCHALRHTRGQHTQHAQPGRAQASSAHSPHQPKALIMLGSQNLNVVLVNVKTAVSCLKMKCLPARCARGLIVQVLALFRTRNSVRALTFGPVAHARRDAGGPLRSAVGCA
eukprot:5420891-Prymnesium_polylepis.1